MFSFRTHLSPLVASSPQQWARMASLALALALTIGCQSTTKDLPPEPIIIPKKKSPKPPNNRNTQQSAVASNSQSTPAYNYIDSTVFFDNEQASVSMRASLQKNLPTPAPLTSLIGQGHQFQFRTKRDTVKISNILVVSDGKPYTIEDGAIFLPQGRGITVAMTLENTRKINSLQNSLLMFRYQEKSFIVTMDNNRLIEIIGRDD